MHETEWAAARTQRRGDAARLQDGARVAVLGSGPAGAFFAYFLLDMARRADLQLTLDLYECRDFTKPTAAGCNMCGGIISESLVQVLAAEGILLPAAIVQRGIDSYVLHTDVGSVRIETPLHEKRIAAVHRGSGPRGVGERRWGSFDGHLQALALDKGAQLISERVVEVRRENERPLLRVKSGTERVYDLLAVAVGVNAGSLRLFEAMGYRPPATTKTLIREYGLGEDRIDVSLGSAMHVFLLNVPGLDFAAIIPKGDHATVCLLGTEVNDARTAAFLASPEVRRCMPEGWEPDDYSCACGPRINVRGSPRPYADRVVFIGDCGVTRLYKDGIGFAYRAAKAAAHAAVFHGVSEASLRRHYGRVCGRAALDNRIGQATFGATRLIQKLRFARRALVRMTAAEQEEDGPARRMSTVLWDLFTGSASYREVFQRTLHPVFLGRLGWYMAVSVLGADRHGVGSEGAMASGSLGKRYRDGEIIVQQGEVGTAMYVIQEGQAEVLLERDGKMMRLRVAGPGEVIGEMALFERTVRSATVRALGEPRVLTVDRKTFLQRISDDPTVATRLFEIMSKRIRELSDEVARLKSSPDDARERRQGG